MLDAAEAMKRHRIGLKAATITPEAKDDVGSPNRILREAIGASVIVRTGRKLPRVRPVGGIHAPISVVRMAVGDAYGAKEWREGEGLDEIASRTETHLAPRLPLRRGVRLRARAAIGRDGLRRTEVYGQPQSTRACSRRRWMPRPQRHPNVPYDPQLIDATYALLLSTAGDAPLVIPALNRDGDCLSDLVMQLFGSIAGAESLVLAFRLDSSGARASSRRS